MKNKSKFIILALIILISVIGISYAFFVYDKTGDNSSKLIFGDIYLKMNEGKDTITLTNVFPETAEEARKRTDNQITFTISGINTTTNKDIWYEIMLNEGNEVEGRTRFNPEDLVFDLIEIDENGKETWVANATSYSDLKERRIWVNTINKNTTSEVNKTYKLRMWLSENVFISDTNPNATYDVETFESSYASVKVSVYGDFVEKDAVTGYIIYDMSGLGGEDLESTPIYNMTTGVVTTEVPVIGAYRLIGWSTSQDGDIVYYPGDSIDIADCVNNNLKLYPVVENDKLVQRITNTLNLKNSGNTRYVYGNIVDNNYLWYSGKLWRIVGINSDDSIKIVTDNPITAIAWSTSTSNFTYSSSQVYKWLQNVFLPTLYNADNLILTSTWDATQYRNFPTTKLSVKTTQISKVGLLNIYDFYMSGATETVANSRTYLNKKMDWWTMTSQPSSYVWHSFSGAAQSASTIDMYGVCPSVNLVSSVQLSGGTGGVTDPYTIIGDIDLPEENDELNARVSGEYVKFNNDLYRIVDVENVNGKKLTKIVLAANSNGYCYGYFNENASATTFDVNSGIGMILQQWYNGGGYDNCYGYCSMTNSDNDYSLDVKYKEYIANHSDGVKWYTGPSGVNYENARQSSVSATIGLLRYGELFTGGDFGDDEWLITKYNNNNVIYVESGRASYIDATGDDWYLHARPAFYLRSNIVIADADGDGKFGTGTPDDPFELKQIS